MGIYLRIKFIIQISAIKLGRQKDSKSVAKITKIRIVLLPSNRDSNSTTILQLLNYCGETFQFGPL